MRGQPGDQVQELDQAGSTGDVGRHRQVRPIAQDLADEPGQNPLGPHLHEDPSAGLVHRLHLLAEADPRGQMIDQGPRMASASSVYLAAVMLE